MNLLVASPLRVRKINTKTNSKRAVTALDVSDVLCTSATAAGQWTEQPYRGLRMYPYRLRPSAQNEIGSNPNDPAEPFAPLKKLRACERLYSFYTFFYFGSKLLYCFFHIFPISFDKYMLSSTALNEMKGLLEQEKIRLEKELEAFGASKTDEVAYPETGGNSEDDNAAEITEYADEVSLADRLRSELKDTLKALEAVTKGTYGICRYCKKDIDLKRLEARPTSSSCIDCKKSLTQEI